MQCTLVYKKKQTIKFMKFLSKKYYQIFCLLLVRETGGKSNKNTVKNTRWFSHADW